MLKFKEREYRKRESTTIVREWEAGDYVIHEGMSGNYYAYYLTTLLGKHRALDDAEFACGMHKAGTTVHYYAGDSEDALPPCPDCGSSTAWSYVVDEGTTYRINGEGKLYASHVELNEEQLKCTECGTEPLYTVDDEWVEWFDANIDKFRDAASEV